MISAYQNNYEVLYCVIVAECSEAAKSISVFIRNLSFCVNLCFEKFVLLCGDSLDRIKMIVPLFLLRLYRFLLIFAKTLVSSIVNSGCDAISLRY